MKLKSQEIRIGADVEAFVYNSTQRTFVPCVDILNGTKDNPHPMPNMPKGYATQEDNVMAEFNIPPCATTTSFNKAIASAQSVVGKQLARRDKSWKLQFVSTGVFEPSDLESKQAQEIGCAPDFDAYERGKARTNFPALHKYKRYAGGHIHLGGDFQCPDWVAAMFCDLALGVAAHVGDFSKGGRRSWYGQPGIYRPKPYGIEYRTPNCEWAASRQRTASAGRTGLSLAHWMTTSDARLIQHTFRQIDWLRVRAYLTQWSANKPNADFQKERHTLIQQARQGGLPI